jgi:hypothetical protein
VFQAHIRRSNYDVLFQRLDFLRPRYEVNSLYTQKTRLVDFIIISITVNRRGG